MIKILSIGRAFILLLFLTFETWKAFAQPNVDFSSDVVQGCAPLTVQFRDLSGVSGAKFRWSFGNGNQSSIQNPQAIYYLPGVYEVSLTVTDPSNQSKTLTRNAWIRVFKNPSAQFTANILTGCNPMSTTFRSQSIPGDTVIDSYRWDFGDGNVQEKASLVSHTYQVHGTYSVSLEVTDKNGCSDKVLKNKYIEVKESPKVEFNADQTFSCELPFKVQFSGFASGGGTHQFDWNFGDGKTSKQQNPENTYTTESKFNVSLTVTASNGCKSVLTKSNMISTQKLNPDILLNQAIGCVPFKPKIEPVINLSHPDLEYEWDLGNGKKSYEKVPEAEYTSKGLYTLGLKVSVKGKCAMSISKPGLIQVLDRPKAFFTANDTFACNVPATFHFLNKSEGAILFDWRYSSGYSSSRDLSHQFTQYNNYKVELIATNAGNCSDTFSRLIRISEPEPNILSSPSEGCKPLKVDFKDISFAEDGIVNRVWYFPEGDSVVDSRELSRTFNDSGTFIVKLKIITGGGCERIVNDTIQVGVKTGPSFKPMADTICNQQPVQFTNTTKAKAKVDQWMWLVSGGAFSSDSNGVLQKQLDTGWHDVTLISVNNGCRDSFNLPQQVYVLPPKASFEVLQDSCNDAAVTLLNTSLARIGSKVEWYVAGQKYSQVNELKVSLPPGKHVVQLFIEDVRAGCKDYTNGEIEVKRETKAGFALPSAGCAPVSIQLTNTSSGDLRYFWDLGNGETSEIAEPTVTYSKAGNFEIRLRVQQRLFPQCRDSISRKINISGPVVKGSLSAPESCPPVSAQLTCDSDPDEFKSLYWMIGSGGSETVIPVTQTGKLNHTFLAPGAGPNGEWDVKLVGIDSNGCVGREDFLLPVKGLTQVSLRLGQFAECSGLRYTFAVRLPQGIDPSKMKFQWDFGDGKQSSQAAQTYTYAQSGKYGVNLKVTDSLGCTSEYRDTIDVEKRKMKASLVADKTETNCPPFLVHFFDQSMSEGRSIESYEWDFGDGSKSVLKNPKHNYVTAGNFTVRLKVRDQWGCEDSIVFKDLILVKGPRGSYDFDKKEGCVPLTVNYLAQTSGTSKMEWDMGDGSVIIDSLRYTHHYKDTGRYIPLLILSDSFGCTYTLPPIDTIYVRPFPKPEIAFSLPCSGKEVNFSNKGASANSDTGYSCTWNFGDGMVSNDCSPKHIFDKGGLYAVNLSVRNQFGCAAKTDTIIRVFGLKADYGSENGFACVGKSLKLKDKSQSDVGIRTRQWILDDGDTTSEATVNRTYDRIGPVPIVLMVEDSVGCRDTLSSSQILVIGDTLPPHPPQMLRVSVTGDFSILMDHLPSLRPDFKSYVYQVDKGNGFQEVGSSTDRNHTRLNLGGLNTLSKVYCLLIQEENACGVKSIPDENLRHCTVNVEAVGDTNQAIVNWTPYIGWNEVRSYYVFRENNNSPDDWLLLDSVSGQTLDYIDSGVICHAEHRYRIQAFENAGYSQNSYSDTAHALPVWVNRLPPNELITATVRLDQYVRIHWDSIPSPQMPVVAYILQRSEDGMKWSDPVKAKFSADEFVSDDTKVMVDDRSYYYRSQAIDACGDTSPWSNIGKTILLKADTGEFERPFVYWSHYEGWEHGIERYEIQRKEPDGSFFSLGAVSSSDTMFVDQVTDLVERPHYCYRVIAYRQEPPGKSGEQVISISNEDCAPVRSRIFVPNAFTPNGDGLNETFLVKGMYIKEYAIDIYNRWGEKVFESNSMFSSWNGRFLDQEPLMDVYVYVIRALGVDGQRWNLSGNVHLVR